MMEKQIIINQNNNQNGLMSMYCHLSKIENNGRFDPPNDLICRTWLSYNNDLLGSLAGRSPKSIIHQRNFKLK